MVLEKKIFKCTYAIRGRAALINRPGPFVQIFNPSSTEGSTWSSKKISPGVSKKSFKGVDGRQVLTIGHPEPSALVN